VITVGLPTMLVRYDIFFWGRSWRGPAGRVPAAIAFNLVLDRFIHGLTGAGD